MKPAQLLSYSFSGVMVACMLVVVVLFVRGEFFLHVSVSNVVSRPQTRPIKNWQQLELNGQRSGLANASVRIVEFFDYECPFCKA